MAIPASGEISFNLFNTDRSLTSGTQVDMAAAGTAYSVSYTTDGSNDLKMDEFYGKSAGTTPAPTTAPPTSAPTTAPPTTPPPTASPPTPAPAVTATVTQDCNGTTATSGRIFITNIANGGTDCYVGYNINSGAPETYATTSIGSATSATITGVPDYAYSYSVYIYNKTNKAGVRYGLSAVACYTTPAPTTAPPTAPPTYYITLSSGTSACDAKTNWSNR